MTRNPNFKCAPLFDIEHLTNGFKTETQL